MHGWTVLGMLRVNLVSNMTQRECQTARRGPVDLISNKVARALVRSVYVRQAPQLHGLRPYRDSLTRTCDIGDRRANVAHSVASHATPRPAHLLLVRLADL
jgi:hypothetical protein